MNILESESLIDKAIRLDKEVKVKKKAGKKSARKKNAQTLPETGDAGALGTGAATLLGAAFVGASAVRAYKAKHFRD